MHSAMAQGGRGWRSEPTVGVAPARCLGMYLKKKKKKNKRKKEKKRGVCATRAVRVATMGRGVASTMQPAAHMSLPRLGHSGRTGWRRFGARWAGRTRRR